VVRGRGPRNEGRVRYQNIPATAIEIEAVIRLVILCRLQRDSASPNASKACLIRDGLALADGQGSDNRTIEGLADGFVSTDVGVG
jgi:hypothetical protein